MTFVVNEWIEMLFNESITNDLDQQKIVYLLRKYGDMDVTLYPSALPTLCQASSQSPKALEGVRYRLMS